MKKSITLNLSSTIILLIIPFFLAGQVYNMSNGSITTCSGTFFDSGGAGGNYGNNENLVQTFCPDTPGECFWFDFTSFNTQFDSGIFGSTEDILNVYDGSNTGAPLITSLSGDFGAVDFPVGSSNGCITFEFISTNNDNFPGWEATISCGPCSEPQLTSQQDCIGAIPLCDEHYYQPHSYTGAGNFTGELNLANNCLVDPEDHSSWYIFQANASGALRFILFPNQVENYDWAMFDISNNRCSDIFTGAAPVISCNTSNSLGGFPPVIQDNGRTGANSLFPFNGSGSANGVNGSPYAGDINVTAGQVIAMVVTSPNAFSGFHLDFSASDQGIFGDVTAPTLIDWESPLACGDNRVDITFDDHIDCGTIDHTDFSITGPGGTYAIGNVVGAACGSPGMDDNSEKFFRLDLTTLLTVVGTYTITMTGSIDDICGNPVAPFSFEFEYGMNAGADAGSDVNFCVGNAPAVILGGAPTNPDGGSITWTSIPAGAVSFITTNVNDANPPLNTAAMTEGVYEFIVNVDNGAGCVGVDTTVIAVGDILIGGSGFTSPTCGNNNGSITITSVLTGTAPFTYDFGSGQTTANSATGLAPGNYVITVTESNGCSATQSFTLNDVPGPTLSTSLTMTSSCGGCDGAIDLTVNGGSGPYLYDWDNDGVGDNNDSQDLSALCAGTYCVTVTDANFCTATTCVTITDPGGPSISNIATIPETCNAANGSANANVSGGTAPYQFNWENTANPGVSVSTTNPATGLAAGNYAVTVTNANGSCPFVDLVTLNGFNSPVINSTSSSDEFCGNMDGEASVVISGGLPPYFINWENTVNPGVSVGSTATASNLEGGTYSVTISNLNGSCPVTTTVVVNANETPIIDGISGTDESCSQSDGTVTVMVSGGGGNYTYEWDDPSGQTTSTATGLPAGTYTVTVSEAFSGSNSATIYNEGFEGAHNWLLNTPTGPNGSDNNFWQVNDAEGGVNPGGCGVGNNGDNTLHITSVFCPPCGAAYDAGGLCPLFFCPEANVRAESPDISTVGFSNLTLSFDFISLGDGLLDNASVLYSNDGGTTFNVIDASIKSVNCPTGQGLWEAASYALPADAENISNLRIAFNWTNNDDLIGSDPSVAVNNVIVSSTGPAGPVCSTTASVTIDDNPAPVIDNTSSTEENCGAADGTATIMVSGGSGAFQFNWENAANPGVSISNLNSATGLATGMYNVTVTNADGSCPVTASVNVGAVDAPVIDSAVPSDENCGAGDGAGILAVSGGMGPYQYNWENAANPGVTVSNTNPAIGLSAGTFDVTVSNADGSCPVSTTLTIGNVPSPMIDNISSTDENCDNADGTATLTVSGGNGPFQYNWENAANPGITASTNNPAMGLDAGTYNVTVTNVDGSCPITATVMVGANDSPVVDNVSSTPDNCGIGDGTATLTISAGNGPFQYAWEDMANPGVVVSTTNPATNLASGSYAVTITNMDGTCPVITTVNITLVDPPVISSISATPDNCGNLGGTATVVVSGGTMPYIIEWEDLANPGVVIGMGDFITGLGGSMYQASVSNADGSCTVTATVEVLDPCNCDPDFAVSLTPSDQSCGAACDGQVDAIVSNGALPYTFSWENNSNPGVEISTDEDPVGLCTGSYAVTVTDANGCETTAETTVGQMGGPFIIASASTPANCGAADGIGEFGVGGGTLAYLFAWENVSDPGVIVSTVNPASGLLAGTYSVTISNDDGTCPLVTTIDIPGNSAPVIDMVNSVDENCGSGDGSVALVVSGGTGPYNYLWSDGSTDDTLGNLSAGNYGVTITNVDGSCPVSTIASIGSIGGPSIDDIQSTPVSCVGSDGTVTATISAGIPPYVFNWENNANPGVGIGNTSGLTGLDEGTYNVTVTNADGSCPSVSSIEVMNDGGVLDLSLSSQPTSCFGTVDGQATVTVNGGTMPFTYSWDNGEVGSTASFLFMGPHTVTVTDANGCMGTGSVDVNSPDLIIPLDVSSSPVSCAGGDDGSATYVPTGGTAPYTYEWIGLPGATNSTVNSLSAGVYQVQVTDANGCTSVPVSITVNEPLDPVMVSLTGNDPGCFGGDDGLVTVEPMGGVPSYSYSWNSGDVGPSVLNASAGSYTVTVTDANGCIAIGTLALDQPDAVVAELSSDPAICFDDANGSITVDTVYGGTGPYIYSIDGNNFQTDSIFSGLGASNYTVTVQDINGCEVASSIIVDEPAELTVTLGEDQTVVLGDSTQLMANVNRPFGEPLTYVWETNPFLGCLDCPDPVVRPIESFNYVLQVIDTLGCSGTDDVFIEVDKNRDVYIPNAFSPNNDGINDVFTIYSGISVSQIRRFLVYDRWGEVVWDASNFPPNTPIFGWNGTLKGKTLNPGVFVFYAEVEFIDGIIIPYKGDVTLVR
ncbi:MAG: gliding motility-associated C-terminal domain-containing protein [Bacteroidota bacterium]